MAANGARQTQKSTEQIGQILRAFTLCGFRNDTHHKRRTTFVNMSLLRLKTRRSAFGTSDTQQIFFLHPGYPEGHNLLLSLPAFDSRGIHHETARIACAILANSRWDGFLSLTKDGAAVPDERDDVLLNTRYYFRILDGTDVDSFVITAVENMTSIQLYRPTKTSAVRPPSPNHGLLDARTSNPPPQTTWAEETKPAVPQLRRLRTRLPT
ncbi:hypothetical protein MY10362_003908 [Beauveria mimosiformis]